MASNAEKASALRAAAFPRILFLVIEWYTEIIGEYDGIQAVYNHAITPSSDVMIKTRDINYEQKIWHQVRKICTTGKKWNIIKQNVKKSYYSTHSFAGNELAQTTSNYCDFYATFTCSIMDGKCNLQNQRYTAKHSHKI